jgi:sterol desaturase/sphingolipid hydroxylase (fatty acid hydroxylase superfamily)
MSLAFLGILTVSGLAMLGEHLLGKRRGLRLYGAAPTLSNLGCGLLRGLVGIPIHALVLALYAGVHRELGVASLDPKRPAHWLIALASYDFVYYWAHRFSHRYAVLWAGHAVHHQPDELNFSVLFRAPVVALVQTFPLYLVLAIAGVPTTMYATVAVVVHASMFWLHTRLIPDLPLLGRVFNTPSLHRIHHSSALTDGTRNFGGLFSIWDQLFGTYTKGSAREPECYGILGSPPPRNPILANLLPFRALRRS